MLPVPQRANLETVGRGLQTPPLTASRAVASCKHLTVWTQDQVRFHLKFFDKCPEYFPEVGPVKKVNLRCETSNYKR